MIHNQIQSKIVRKNFLLCKGSLSEPTKYVGWKKEGMAAPRGIKRLPYWQKQQDRGSRILCKRPISKCRQVTSQRTLKQRESFLGRKVKPNSSDKNKEVWKLPSNMGTRKESRGQKKSAIREKVFSKFFGAQSHPQEPIKTHILSWNCTWIVRL